MLNKTDEFDCDECLVKDAQSGDELAENLLIENYKEVVLKISRHYFLIGGEMEDLVQEGMIGLYKAIKNYKVGNNTSFKTFASLCINRQIQTAITRANAKKNTTLSNALSLASDIEDESEESIYLMSEDLPINKLIEKEDMANLLEKITKTLSKKESKVLALYLKGMTYTEIAKTLDITNKSVDNALSRIKQKLKFLNN